MTKTFNFALKIKGVVGRVAHAKSSDPASPPKFGTCTKSKFDGQRTANLLLIANNKKKHYAAIIWK